MFQTLAALIVFLFPLAFSPGPGNMFFAANGARFGLVATLPLSLGYHVATWIVTATIGFGFIAAMEQFPHLFTSLKIAGAGYVLWLAWKLFRAGGVAGDQEARAASFMDGVILLVLNPKAYVIIALMFTQFLGETGLSHFREVLVITTVFTLNNFIAFTIWTLIGDKIASLFRKDDHARKLNIFFAIILADVALWMLVA